MKTKKETTARLELLEVYDGTAIARKVEAMAARGWLAERVGPFLWHYRRCPPQALHAAVQYFPKASDFDPGPGEAEREMMDFAARDGWQPLLRWGQAQVFVSTAADPTPLHTDPVAQVATLRKALLRSQLPTTLALLLLCGLMTAMYADLYRRDPLDFLSDGIELAAAGLMALLLFLLAATLVRLAVWLRRAPAAAQAGVFLPAYSARRFNSAVLVLAALLFAFGVAWSGQALPILLVWAALYLLVLRASLALKERLKAAGAPRGVNRFATVALAVVLAEAAAAGLVWLLLRMPLERAGHVTGSYTYPSGYTRELYADPLPLTMQDLIEVPPGEVRSRERERSATPLLAVTDCRDWGFTEPDSGQLAYTLYEPNGARLYGFCQKQLLAQYDTPAPGPGELADHWFAVDAAPWGAEAAYQRFWSDGPLPEYLVCWPGRLLVLRLPWEPTPAQRDVIVQKLCSGS